MKKIILLSVLLLLPTTSFAVATDATTAARIVQDALNASTTAIFNELSATAFKMLAIFMMMQWFIINFKSLISGAEVPAIFAKFLGFLAWGSVIYYVMDHGVTWLTDISNFFYERAGAVAGTSFSPGYVMEYGLTITADLLRAVDSAQGLLESLNPLPSIMTGFCAFVILLITGLIAFKIFMLLAETSIVIALAPFSFAFMGLSMLKEQGLVPFKYLISMAYRAMIYAAVIAAMGTLGAHISAVLQVLPTLDDVDIWTPIFAIVLGYGMLGALALRADSIAAMLSSGTSQITTGDASAVAAAAGAAGGSIAGKVLGSASAVAGGAAAAPKAMSEFMSHMTSGSGKTGQGFSTPQIGDAPIRAQTAPAPTPSSPAAKAMADAGSKATSGKAPENAVNAGVEALTAGKDKGAAMSAMMNHGATPHQAKAAVDAMRPDGDGTGAGIGGSSGKNSDSSPSSSGSGRGGIADSLANLDRHMSRDDKAVHVSMNVNAE